ncbi:MAG: tetratricopeptide repeat protein [bacterium]|nr:tetratricopeptide repeat protein [bacterium]
MGKLLSFITRVSIVLTVFLIPLAVSPWTFEAFEFPKQYLLIFLVFLGTLAWFAKMVLVEREVHVKRTPLDLPILLFVFFALLSSVFSADLWSSLFGYYGRFSDGIFGILASALLYFLITNTIQRPASLVRPFLISVGLAVGIGYLSLFGVLSHISELWPLVQQVGFNPVSGSLEGFAVFLAFLVSFLAFLSVRPEIRQLPFVGNLLLLVSGFGILLLIDMQEAWVILLFGLLLALLAGLFHRSLTGHQIRLRRLWLPFVLLLLTVILLFSSARLPQMGQQFQRESVLSKEISWGIASDTVKENGKNLLLGSGPGTFAVDFSQWRPAELNMTPQWQARFDRAGSHFAELLATLGILGFLSYLGLLFWFFLVSLLFLKDRKNFPFVLGVAVLFLGQALYYQTTVLQVAFWLFLALAAISWELPPKEFRFSLRGFPEFKVAAQALLLFFLFGFGAALFFGAKVFAADMNYLASQNTKSTSSVIKIDVALEASRLNPWQAEYKIYLSRLYLQRALTELRKSEGARSQEQISQDVQLSIAYTRGDTLGVKEIVGATELSPKRVASWETLGAVYRDITFASGALDWAIRSFEAALSLEPANPVLYTEVGKLYVTKEEFLKARERLEKAVELKPDFVPPRFQLALLREKEGDSAKALLELRELVLTYPLDTESAFQLGRMLYNAGEVEEAILQFQGVLKLAPNHSNALFALGVALEKQGRVEEAVAQFEKVLQLNPGNVDVQERLQGLRE